MKLLTFYTLILFQFIYLPQSFAWDLGTAGKFQFDKIANNVHVMHGPLDEPNKVNRGFMNNPGIIVAKNEVILVDPGGAYKVGKNVLIEIEKITKKPITAVFNTHIHGDHWLANQAIKEKYPNVKIYASSNTVEQANNEQGIIWIDSMKRMTEGDSADTKIVPAFITVKDQDELVIGGEKFVIHASEKAHTDTDIMIEHKSSQTLFLGDNNFSHRLGRFDGSSDIKGNIDILERAKKLNLSHYVPGHGQTANFEEAVQPFLDYLILLDKQVKIGYDEGIENFEIKKNINPKFVHYHSWHGFDSNFGKHINKRYAEIEASEF